MSNFLKEDLSSSDLYPIHSDSDFYHEDELEILLSSDRTTTILIQIDEDDRLKHLLKLLDNRVNLFIYIKNDISFRIDSSNYEPSLSFYQDINGEQIRIEEEGLFYFLESRGINRYTILSALKSNLKDPRIIDFNIITTKVAEILEEPKKENEKLYEEKETKRKIIMNNRLLIVMPGFNPLVGEDDDSIEEINNMLKNPEIEIPSKFYVGIFKDMLINIYEYGHLNGYNPDEELGRKENKYISCIEQLFGKINREEVMKIVNKSNKY